jgi:transcriptional regulator of heat shock response
MKFIVESLWDYIDWAAVGFIKDDEYYYLWINNLMKEKYSWEDFDYIKYLVDFIEHKKIVTFLNRNQIERDRVYYTFISDEENVVSSIHTKINVNWLDGIVSILWPMRMNYEKNIWVLKKLLKSYNKACS